MKRGTFFDKIENNPKRLRRLEEEKEDKEKREVILYWKKMVEDGMMYTDSFTVFPESEKEKYYDAGFEVDECWVSAPQFFKQCVTDLLEFPDNKYWTSGLLNEEEYTEFMFFFETIGWETEIETKICSNTGTVVFWEIRVTPK